MALQNIQYIPSWSPLRACPFVLSAHHDILSLLFMKPSPHKAGVEQQSGNVHTVTGAISNERRRSQRSQYPAPELKMDLATGAVDWMLSISAHSIRANYHPHEKFMPRMQTAQTL